MDFKVISGVIGGLGLFVFGMFLLSDSLKRLSLGLLKTMLERATSGRFRSALMGAFITSVIQSSSATSVIVIGFLNAGFIPLMGAVAVMIGANVGTTVTAQLIAFKFTAVAPLFVFIGAVTFLAAKKDKHKNKGRALLGFGLLFLGLGDDELLRQAPGTEWDDHKRLRGIRHEPLSRHYNGDDRDRHTPEQQHDHRYDHRLCFGRIAEPPGIHSPALRD
jgi:Na/Pi-cotransporter